MLKWDDIVAFARNGNPTPRNKIAKTEAEWQKQLSEEAFIVTRKAGTERPFSSEMCSLFEPSLYSCVCCNTTLFDAREKFESGTGWPSFTQPVDENDVSYHADASLASVRIEAKCNNCDAHLGHVFPDGPEPSGLRYCMNAVALQKVESS